jgi:glycosyltransferase involved in cell wall biosynthesis
VLLIAFKFPPYAGVGGYRWAKLSKYLARLGRDVHVVTVPWREWGPNTLTADVRHERITVHRVRSGGPHNLRNRPIESRRLAVARALALRPFERALWFDDEAQRWGRRLLPACERLVDEHGIRLVVATGHPFQANRWAAELKRRRPGLKLVQDFRDPWADNPFRRLSARQAAQVRGWQRDAVGVADAVVAVTDSLLDLYLRDAPDARGVVIPNGVDPEDAPAAAGRPHGDGIRIAHIGNIGNGRDRPLAALLEALRGLDPGQPRIQVLLVGGALERFGRLYPDLVERGLLEIRPPVAHGEAMRLVAGSDYALQLNAREFPYLVSTKVYEYALMHVPAISLNYGGEVAALVEERGFGHSLDLSEGADIGDFVRSLPERAGTDRDGRFRFDVEPFTYPVLAERYSALMEDLCSAA